MREQETTRINLTISFAGATVSVTRYTQTVSIHTNLTLDFL